MEYPKLIKVLGSEFPTKDSKRKRKYNLFLCECGKEFKTRSDYKPKSCGCKTNILKGIAGIKHGMHNTRIYKIHESMLQRCYNAKAKAYSYYGFRGISVYDEWKKDFLNFYNWAIKNGYDENLTIDRINPYGNYEPDNCRWADKKTQSRNIKRIAKNNTSGLIGVVWFKRDNTWKSQIVINRKNKHIGYYKCKIQAAFERDLFIIKNNLEHTRNFERIKV